MQECGECINGKDPGGALQVIHWKLILTIKQGSGHPILPEGQRRMRGGEGGEYGQIGALLQSIGR